MICKSLIDPSLHYDTFLKRFNIELIVGCETTRIACARIIPTLNTEEPKSIIHGDI